MRRNRRREKVEGERNNKRENGEEGKEKAGRERVKARENLEEPLKKKFTLKKGNKCF